MSDFASQMKQVVNSPEYRQGGAPKQDAPVEQVSKSISQQESEIMDSPFLPMGQQPEAKPSVTEAPVDTPKPPAKFKIGDREFATPEEAFQFVAEQNARLEGKEQAIKELTKPKEEEAPKPPPFEKEMADLMFTDPEEYNKRMYQKATEDAMTKIWERYQVAQQEEAAKKAADQFRADTWTSFYEKNHDLSGFRELVQTVIDKMPADTPINKALESAASETRKLLQKYRSATVPTTELSSTPIMPATGSVAQRSQASGNDATDKKVDGLIAQMLKNRPGKQS